MATDLPHQRADLPRGAGGRAAPPAGRRTARDQPRRPARRGRALDDGAPDRAATDPRPRRGLARVDRGVPGRRPPRLLAVPADRAAHGRRRRRPARRHQRRGPSRDPPRARRHAHGDRHLLRAAVHARAVSPARPRPQPARLRAAAAGALGDRVRPRRQITRRLPGRLRPILPVTGYLLLAAAYLAIGAALSTGRPGDLVLAALLGLGPAGVV